MKLILTILAFILQIYVLCFLAHIQPEPFASWWTAPTACFLVIGIIACLFGAIEQISTKL